MRSFFRTFAGKLILVLICVLSVLTAAACVGGAALTVSAEDGYVHLITRDEIEQNETGRLREISRQVLNFLLNWGRLPEGYEKSWSFAVWNATTGEMLYNDDADLSAVPIRDFHFYAFKENGWYKVRLEGEDVTGHLEDLRAYWVRINVRNDFVYSFRNRCVDLACRLGWWIFAAFFAALGLAAVSFVSLMRVSARRPGREDPVPGPLHKVPYDLMLAAGAAVFVCLVFFFEWVLPVDSKAELHMVTGAAAVGVLILLGLCMSAAARVKTKTLIKNTLIFRVLKYLVAKPLAWLWKGLKKLHAFNMSILRGLPLVGKTALFLGVLAIVELNVTAAADGGPLVLLSLIKYLILIPLVLYFALCLRRLQKGGEALAAGDLTYQTETKGLPHDLKKHAEDLNSIGGGMAIAVREQLKSERMKTELITNVSHDLKTPLTSLINYADLISKEPCENAKIKEYSGVLLRQSERLKRLIDDLVEASKASTGNLEVDLVPCDASVFLAQAAGEYEEKLRDAGLALVTKQPDEEVSIMADGRRMWRIFDNLMNNIVKYSLSGTRVYLSLEQADGDAVITFRNTSREPLDAVNTEELVERFTRGDASRNTEGSGLGLAIAKSLTELQGGKFLVSADGDLFKVILRFPKI